MTKTDDIGRYIEWPELGTIAYWPLDECVLYEAFPVDKMAMKVALIQLDSGEMAIIGVESSRIFKRESGDALWFCTVDSPEELFKTHSDAASFLIKKDIRECENALAFGKQALIELSKKQSL